MVYFDPYDRDYADNPYPVYKQLRDEAPVYHSPERNFWALSRYEDVREAHRDFATWSSAGGVTIEGYDKGAPVLIVKDPPEHRWHKELITKVFTVQRMAALEPFARKLCVELLERLSEADEFDLVQEFALQVPLQVISELIGIPDEYRQAIHDLANQSIAREDGMTPERQKEINAKKFAVYIHLIQERRAKPRNDPITCLIESEIRDNSGALRRLSDLELAFRFSELSVAGHETVSKAIPNGLMSFQRFPAERRKLIEQPGLLDSAVEEILRFEPPSQLQGRTATRDVALHGVTIPAGSKTMLLTGSATHDERRFPDPETFDISRKSTKESIYFGLGIHRCLGINLARVELRVVFQELFRRFPHFEVDPSRAKRPIQSNVRGVSSLPGRLGKPGKGHVH